jgi:hypothetical protein
MSVIITKVEEVKCNACGHVWIVRDGNHECPECRRRVSEVTSVRKNRHLCIACHHVWMTDALIDGTFCPKCGESNEEGKKVIARDSVLVYTCGACGNEWIEENLFELGKDDYGSPTLLHKAVYCGKCGCGREKALEEKRKKDEQSRRRQTRGYGYTIYRGHTQTTHPDTGKLSPSKEEIDARIAAGIWKDESPEGYQAIY